MKPIPDDTTQIVRQGVEKACRDFSGRIAAWFRSDAEDVLDRASNIQWISFIFIAQEAHTVNL
jgi:hypothetical protein